MHKYYLNNSSTAKAIAFDPEQLDPSSGSQMMGEAFQEADRYL
jgi:hypothetical protein